MPSTEKPKAETGTALYKHWMTEIQDALKREKKFREEGQKCVDIYEGRKADEVPFAILYSNTETLIPAVYNSKPIPIVTRRFKNADPVGKAVSEVSTRVLKYLIDAESKDYEGFDDLINPAVLQSLLVNRGFTRFKFVGNMQTECVYGEDVRWDKFFHGYARTWKKLPWLGFEWDMSEDDIRKNFQGVALTFNSSSAMDDEKEAETKEELTGVTTYKVYEVWDKASRKVRFFSPVFVGGALREVDDPLGLPNFFPGPKPMNFMKKVSTLVPTPLYVQYRQQAVELNDITLRLKAIIKAVKVRGAYNSTIEGIAKMLEAGDNELVPVENMDSMPEGAGIDRALFILPISDLVSAAQSLYSQREQVKQVIYEITGISDILRGASVASETATAQNIKNQWGTLRLKKMQKEVQRYCRDCLEIILEIAGSKFEVQTLQQMTGLSYPTAEQKQQIQMQVQMQQQQAQQQAMMTGQEAPSPQVPPEVQELLATPTWEDITGVLHNEVAMSYKIDIETNSTIDAEASQDKQDISELLNAISQFLNGVAPLVEKGLLPMDVAKTMLLTISRRFNFGSQLEDALNKMQAPAPQEKGPDPAEQMKAQVAAEEAKAKLAEIQAKAKLDEAQTANKMKLMAMQQQVAEAQLEIQRQELDIQRQALGMKAMSQQHQHNLKMQTMTARAQAAENKEPANADV